MDEPNWDNIPEISLEKVTSRSANPNKLILSLRKNGEIIERGFMLQSQFKESVFTLCSDEAQEIDWSFPAHLTIEVPGDLVPEDVTRVIISGNGKLLTLE